MKSSSYCAAIFMTLLSHSCRGYIINAPTTCDQSKNEGVDGKVYPSKGFAKPDFYNTLEGPEYRVLQHTDKYEVREYRTAHWVTTNETAIADDTSEAFMKLYSYIARGENDRKMKIPMSVPVATKVVPGKGPNCESFFETSFFLPWNLQCDPPKPTDPTVYLSITPNLKVYVRSFGGYIQGDSARWQQEAVDLAKAIGNPELVEQGLFFKGGYNSPFQLFNRHNEVWLVAKPQ